MTSKQINLLSLFSVSLIFLVTVAGFAGASNEPKVYVRGHVVDQNDAVIVGAAITLKPLASGQASAVTTDSNGDFVAAIEPGEYEIQVKAEGFSDVSKRVTISPTESSAISISLQILPNTVTVDVVDSGEYQTGSTMTATKTMTPLRDIPQSISIIGERQITDQLFTNIGDTVRYVPGITAHQGENNRDQVIIRGQNSSADFFVNGVRDDVQYYRDLYNLESVEVIRGPNAMIFGRGGGGGVINRVTKEAAFGPFYAFGLQGGSYRNGRATADINTPLNSKFALRVNALAEGADSFRDFVNRRRFGFTPSVTFTPDAKTRLTFTYEYLRDRRVADRGITSYSNEPANVPISTFYGNPDDSHVRANVHLSQLGFERQFGKLIVRNRTMYGDYDRFYQNYVPGAANADGTKVALSAYNNSTRRKNLFNQTDLNYVVQTGKIRHTLLGGTEFGRQLTDNFRNSGYFNNQITTIQVAFDSPQTNIPVTFRQSATDANNRVRVNLGAAYVQDQVEITRYLQIVGGVRYDYFDLRFHNNRNGQEFQRADRLVSPRFGVVVKPVTSLSLYGSYSVSYLPSAGDQFSSLAANTETLKPEKFTNYEAGIKWDIRRNLSLTTAIYRLDRTNTRAIDPNDSSQFVPTGAQRTNGVELGLGGQITRAWSFTGGYSYQEATITKTTSSAPAGRPLAQVPHSSYSAWNKYQIAPRLAAGLGIVARSSMFAALDNTVKLPGYVRADAAVYYTISENWKLQTNVENIFNKRYYVNADNNNNISPGAPASVKVALTARF
jgi:catecholate siderophore receptor